jgi:glycosyltransferase involved in cell wall biosynthesis
MAVNVSIVIGTYNYADYLPAAVESALAQVGATTEVVVVDDGSTDGTPGLLNRWSGSIVNIRTENRGQLAALATGFARTSGRMVVFLDADDVLLPQAAQVIRDASTDDALAKLHWPMPEIDDRGLAIGSVRPTEALPSGDLTAQLCRLGPEGAAYPPTSGNAWRREFLERVLPGPGDQFRLAADQYLAVLAPFHGLVGRVDEPLSQYRRHADSVHSSAPLDERIRITNDHYGRTATLLRSICEERGMACEWEAWEEHSWTRRLEQTLDELDRAVPPGSTVVLMDQDEWALPDGRPWVPVPIPSDHGHYAGLPADSSRVIGELEDRRLEGATHLVITDSAFWWLDAYEGLSEYLRTRALAISDTDRYRLFELSELTP